MNKLITALVFACGTITSLAFVTTLYTNNQNLHHNKNNNQTPQNVKPCTVDEVITFFNLLQNNAAKLNYSLTSKKTKNDLTKTTWSYPQEEFGSDVTYTFYIPVTDYLFYSHKERYYGCDYILYKGKLQNSDETLYLLTYNHSGSGNYGGIIGAWTIDNNRLTKKNCCCFYTDECPQHLADNFIVTHNGTFYLQFIEWKQNKPFIQHYIWENDSLKKADIT